MSRRKQARPVRLLEDGSHVPAGEGTGSEDEGGSSCGEGGVFCPGCQTEVGSMSELEDHLKDCRGGKAAAGGPEEEARRQDAENNNSSVEESVGERAELGLVAGHVTLEALQNTKVAVAQFAATAMANNADNAAALQELAVLQSTLYTLQQQQMLQLNLIHQLQQQLQITRTKDGPAPPSPKPSPEPVVPASQSVPATPPPRPLTPPKTLAPEPSASLPPCSVSSSFASSIITNLDPPPSPSEPNTLEMLQRRAQEVLDNASQGLLANNLADELAFRKSKGSLSPYDSKSGRNEPFFKHRCRYCGKVFGSDSALQIHIRSHTGERPFKCNVCGSRFTTKGNLKVHFQRHTVKFPHIKMNPNPVPEHLDKYHPPLLAQMGAHQSLPPGVSPPQFPTGSQFGLPMYRPPHPPSHDQIGSNSRADPKSLMPLGVFGPRIDTQDVPENLSKSVSQPSPQSTGDGSERCKREVDDIGKDSMEGDSLPVDGSSRLSPKHEMEGDYDSEQPNDRYPSPTSYDDCSFDSKYTSEDVIGDRESPGMEKNDDSLQEQPENLSNKSMSNMDHCNLTNDSRIPPPIQFPCIISPSSSASSGSVHRLTPRGFGSEDPAKDPAIYSNLLPRPGSNDNSWESLIEIDKSSETSKLQQLVDNIEHKLTDPNQCVVCFRVLSCKSALQMHYRTHTGERPFRCKICGRAFTTKGNLKTHMGVHRIKPPVRTLHQCPVCHKKFTNGLVLQQHIRLHTGEPTDLTPDQIQAAEIKDPPPDPPPFSALFSHSFPITRELPAPNNIGLQPPINDPECNNNVKEEQKSTDPLDECRPGSVSPISDAAFSTSLNALENQVRTITNMSFQNSQKQLRESEDVLANVEFGPVAVNGSGCDDSEGGCSPGRSSGGGSPPGVLDLSGAAAGQPQVPPGGTPQQQVPSLFPPFPPGLLPPPPPQAPPSPLISSALSSLTSSVLTSTTFNPLALTVNHPGERRFTGRGNTTCQLCFKTFACNSALEIHYRSHTKERPFKCSICERGFSTKRSGPCAECQVWLQGNMKQHMLTHKIRDMPAHLFDQQQRSEGVGSAAGPPVQLVVPPPPSAPSTPTTPTPPMPTKEDVEIPSRPPSEPPQRPLDPIRSSQDSSDEAPPAKRPTPPDHSEPLPAPKRPHSLPKHLCNVCNKNFSSSSALQIHMRTHTGDKPFRCTICHKAFTTKGNLKVHMGTHMWTNGASRRGRRMSLELPPLAPPPPPHPPQLKDSPDSYLHPRPRPDLFYPYLPAPFLNGIHQKVSELASTGQLTGGNGMVGLGGFGMDLKVERRSPEPKVPLPTSLWYFERRQPGTDPASPRSEGLTA